MDFVLQFCGIKYIKNEYAAPVNSLVILRMLHIVASYNISNKKQWAVGLSLLVSVKHWPVDHVTQSVGWWLEEGLGGGGATVKRKVR